MPQQEGFWNPYRLIPVKSEVKREAPLTDEKFAGSSGCISCALENLTPLFVGKNPLNPQLFLTRKTESGDLPVIPGSSLKGMLRSLAEIVGGGCFLLGFQGGPKAPTAPCDDAGRLCIACRMFGMMERGKGARVHKGKISIGDALLQGEKAETGDFQILLSSCGTRHEPFYRSPHTGRLDGKARKLYFHQPRRQNSVPPVPDNLRSRAWNIKALLAGHRFDFEVRFSNLTDDELNLLVYVLALEENVGVEVGEEGQRIVLTGPMRHKVGNAKPLGMGSCRISIGRIVLFAEPQARFESLQQTNDRIIEGDDLVREIESRTRFFAHDRSDTMRDLRKMMVWDENDPRDFHYPDYYWFKNPANSSKTLKAI